jgi:bifunctional UDP-N-acetylglucosamine pyrophosphorylase/glucosamine-1-phosphate N-acetyltransferase
MASASGFSVIVLAAGKGTRMKSPLPKVVHPVAGQPMIYRIVDAAMKAGALETRLVVGAGSLLVQRVVEPLGATCFYQEKQLGTADAVASAEPQNLEGPVIIIGGDHPLITAGDFEWLVREYSKRDCQLAVVSCEVNEPGSYGRIVRNHGRLYSIVEAKDASAEALKICEVNTGIYVMDAEVLNKYLPKINNENQQNEYYFTDIVSLSIDGGESVDAIIGDAHMAQGVNDQEQLAAASKSVFSRKATELMKEGVIFVDPDRTYIEDDVSVAAGTVIYPGVYVKGPSRIGSHCVLEPNVFIEKAEVGDSVQLKAGTYLNDCKIAKGATLGPYAHIRPQTEIGEDCKVGNFVELKKTKMGKGSKASHLAYLGDTEVGENVNFGCGAITVNYAVDKKKYKTIIEDDAFVGSDCCLVAPVTIGKGAMIGAGSTITKDVPGGALAVARGKQIVKENYSPKAPSNLKADSKDSE